MPWTPPVHIAPGSQGSSTQMNAQVMDNLTWLHTNDYRASAHVAGTPSVPSSTTILMPVDTVDYDPSSMFNPATSLFTIPVKGYYWISVAFRMTGAGNVLCGGGIYVNQPAAGPSPVVNGPNLSGNGIVFTRELLVNAGDTLGAAIFNGDTTAHNLNNGATGSGNSMQVVLRAQTT